MSVIVELRLTLRNRFLAAQKLWRFIESDLFEKAFDIASDEDKSLIQILIQDVDKDELFRFCENIIEREENYAAMPVMKLRELAKSLGVCNYNYLPRDLLLSEIAKRNGRVIPPSIKETSYELERTYCETS